MNCWRISPGILPYRVQMWTRACPPVSRRAAAVEQLSLRKALPLNNGTQIVIGADTVVAVDGTILGKPADEAEARQMLARLSGRWHSVFTGVSLVPGRTASDFLLRDPGALL